MVQIGVKFLFPEKIKDLGHGEHIILWINTKNETNLYYNKLL